MNSDNKGFVHLHVHTEYSLQDGMNKIPQLVQKLKALGMKACAITDHGNCYGLVKFYSECKAAGIKPILGCEFYEAPASRLEKKPVDGENYYHLILLVKNAKGYENLCHLTKRAAEGIYYKPRIDIDSLEQYHEGLICLSACLAGRIPTDIKTGKLNKAREDAKRYKEIFGEDFYLEIQNHGIREEEIVAHELYKIGQELGIKLVCTNDCHYLNSEDAEAHKWLMCMQHDHTIDQADEHDTYHGDYSVKSEEEMRALFPSIQEAFDNTVEIADKCDFDFEFGKYKMPTVHIPEEYGKDFFRYLEDITWQGFEERYPEGHPERDQARKDIDFELDIIKKMGFAEYFLDIKATIDRARSHDVIVGPGRGSGAGSRVNYCLHITDIDPIKYGLLFERFLNPERVSMPDIDTDFAYDRREDVIRYEAEAAGNDHFCKIQTLQSMFAKGVIRATFKVGGYPPAVINKIAKMIPDEAENLEQAMDMNPELRDAITGDADYQRVWNIARKLEGLKKSGGTHACGHISVPEPCENLFPVRLDTETGYLVCQYDMNEAEHLGNLKKDLLMLRNLTIISEAHKAIKARYGIEVPMWTDEILNDKEALQLFWKGDTAGIFQFESEGMKKFMKELKPTCFEDIIAGVSLYRPGPMDYIPDYIKGKHHPEEVTYDFPELEEILAPTYGVITYQEQVMQIVQLLAGFSKGEADVVRKGMGKKKQEIIEAEGKKFIDGDEKFPGCVGNGYDRDKAIALWAKMSDFGKYAFNKSHAACYAVIAMQTAYLKAHYPAEFFAGLLTSVSDDLAKLIIYVNDCKAKGIVVHKPNINSSGIHFESNDDHSITYGLEAIKAVGSGIVEAIIEERSANGPYESIVDLAERIPAVNKGLVEAMAKAGALDCFGLSRNAILFHTDSILKGIKKEKKTQIEGQMSLFDVFEDRSFKQTVPNMPEMDRRELLRLEKEATGMYISGHPIDTYLSMLPSGMANSSEFVNSEETECKYGENEKVTIAGIITKLNTFYTKAKNQQMAIFQLEDLTGSVKVLGFPKTFAEYKAAFVEDAVVLVHGKVMFDETDGTSSIAIDSIENLSDSKKKVYLLMNDDEMKVKMAQLELAINETPGQDDIILILETATGRKMQQRKSQIDYNQAKSQLENIFTPEKVAVKIA